MAENKLKTAVLGLGDRGSGLLEAASKVDYFQIQAVADRDSGLAEKSAEIYKCTAYDDYRQLIIQNNFDCLLVAAGLYNCDEYIRMAIKKKFNILKLAPPARDFEEAAGFVRLAEDEGVKFVIANPGRFSKGFVGFRKFLQQRGLEHTFLITAVCDVGGQSQPVWHTDPKSAGGGVLLRNCYQLIDQIVWNFAVPEQVYSLNTNTAGDRQQRLYLTEDTVVVTMRFTDSFFANLTASRIAGSGEEFLKVYGKDKIVTVGREMFAVSDHLGQPVEQLRYQDDESACMMELLINFAEGLLLPDKNRLCSSARENLRNMAVIESAYLSARTGMPEEPGRVLQMVQIEPEDVRLEHK